METLTKAFSFEDIRKIANSTFSVALVHQYMTNYHEFDDVGNALDMMQEKYHGCFNSYGEYARVWFENTGDELPEYLRDYIDYERLAHDWEKYGNIEAIMCNDELHFFEVF